MYQPPSLLIRAYPGAYACLTNHCSVICRQSALGQVAASSVFALSDASNKLRLPSPQKLPYLSHPSSPSLPFSVSPSISISLSLSFSSPSSSLSPSLSLRPHASLASTPRTSIFPRWSLRSSCKGLQNILAANSCPYLQTATWTSKIPRPFLPLEFSRKRCSPDIPRLAVVSPSLDTAVLSLAMAEPTQLACAYLRCAPITLRCWLTNA